VRKDVYEGSFDVGNPGIAAPAKSIGRSSLRGELMANLQLVTVYFAQALVLQSRRLSIAPARDPPEGHPLSDLSPQIAVL
jgi:hypothetical protein